jgi:amidase
MSNAPAAQPWAGSFEPNPGHKPTYGIASPRGQALPGVVAASDISVVGPPARSAADLALALNVMAGPDDIDGHGS